MSWRMRVGVGLFLAVSAPRMVWTTQATVSPWAELEEAIRHRGLDPARVIIPGRLTEEMREWLLAHVSARTQSDTALRQLVSALVDPAGFGLEYDPSYTGTAAEVFETRKANCLAFTHLFVGMSRELGIPAYYVRWQLIERSRREGDLVVVSGHISAGIGSGGQRQVLEFGLVSGLEVQGARAISDINAVARHYANRSAELLRQEELKAAVTMAEMASQLDPDLPDGWVNLGVALRRTHDLRGAEEAYRRATLADPDHLPAYHNLSVLYQFQGKTTAAREILALLDRRDNHNPFIYLALGDESFRSGRVEEADRFYRKAWKYGPELAETRAARGASMLRLGKIEKARKWLRRAEKADSGEARTLELSKELSRVDTEAHYNQ